MSVFDESVALHEKFHGKIELTTKVPLENMHDLSLAYTPGVAQVCREIAADPEKAYVLTPKSNLVAVVSDGSAILGLGNLGAAAAIPVMEGKAALFKKFAEIDAFPICLDTQNVDEIVETVVHIAPVFGGINLEDISAPRCFEVERRLKALLQIPVMHDDQHGTATVVLAALINALTLRDITAAETRVVISGAGAAGTAIAELLLAYGVQNIIVCDSKGIISIDRTDLNEEKISLAKITNAEKLSGGLAEALRGAHVFIGVSAAGALSASLIPTMAERPIIMAMANPVPEIMPDEALAAGAFIVATGRSDFPNQINNVLAFPGIFRGALDHRVRDITNAMLVQAAKNIAACVANPTTEEIIPSAFDMSVVPAVAIAIK